MNTPREWTDAAIAGFANKTSIGAAVVSVFSWVQAQDIGFWLGIVVAVAGLWVNYHFKRRDDRRKQERHEVEMQMLRLNNPIPALKAYDDE